MTTLAGVILIFMVLLVLVGAAQVAFGLIILIIIYLCICSVYDSIVSWLKKHDS